MQTCILAAGPGTRLRPLTKDRPKALLNVAGKPLIQWTLDALDEPPTLVVGHGQRAVRAYMGDRPARFVIQEAQLGPGHALLQARTNEAEIVVLPGDAWYHPDLIERLRQAPTPAMVQVPDARSGRHGVPVVEGDEVVDLLELEHAGDRATGFCGGAYKVDQALFECLEKSGHSMRDAIRMHLKEGPWHLVKARPNEYVDVIEAQDLLRVQDLLMPGIDAELRGTIEEGAHVSGPVHLGEGSTIRAGAVVQGPVTIGDHCDIQPGAVLMPGTAMRNRVRIGPLSLLERCSLASNVTLGAHSHVRDAVIDNGATLGAYVQCEASTGILVGADAQVGDRVTLEAGAVIGREASVANGRRIQRVPDGGQAV